MHRWVGRGLGVGTLCGLVLGWWFPAPAGAAARPAPRAYSFLGLQVTPPAAWSVQYFPTCGGVTKDALAVGRLTGETSCASGPAGPTVWALQVPTPSALEEEVTRWQVVHGLWIGITAPQGQPDRTVTWYVPSAGAEVSATGTRALAVLRSLRPATTPARPAPGLLTGTEQDRGGVPGTGPSALSGPVRLVPARGRTYTAQTMATGTFQIRLPAGEYLVHGTAGSGSSCPPVPVTVAAGGTAHVDVTCSPNVG